MYSNNCLREGIRIPVILDAFKKYSVESRIGKNRSFRMICVVPSETDQFKEDFLYVCSLADAKDLTDRGFLYSFLCPDTDAEEPVPENTAVIHGLFDLFELMSLALERFAKIREWMFSLSEAADQNETYQKIVDLSEEILSNTIYILDGAYQLIACTRTIIDDVNLNNVYIREHKKHSEEFLQKLAEKNRLSAYQNESGLIVYSDEEINKYTSVTKWIWDSGTPALEVVMVCSNEPYTESGAVLTEYFSGFCSILYQKKREEKLRGSYYYDSLLKDMIFENLTNVRMISERARYAGIELKGNYEVYTISLKKKDSYPLVRLAQEISTLLPDSYIVFRAYHIVVLNKYPNANDKKLAVLRSEQCTSVRKLLEKHAAVCGISELFTDFLDLHHAYLQAVRAVGAGTALNAYAPEWKTVAGRMTEGFREDPFVYRYEDIYLHYLIHRGHLGEFDIHHNTPIVRQIEKLIEEDRKNDRRFATLLYTYLVCERNAAKTGEMLHMHRNNVLYHLPKIESKLCLSLDDFQTRMKILAAFFLIELDRAYAAEKTTVEYSDSSK